MAVYVVGSRAYGKIDRHGDAYVATRMRHLNFLPLYPMRGVLVWKDANGVEIALPIRRVGRSVAAAYLRTWSLLGLVVGVFLLCSGHSIVGGLLFGLCPLLLLVVHLGGRLDRVGHAKADVYRVITGLPFDPALLAGARAELRGGVRDTLRRRGAQLEQAARYRTGHDPERAWVELALDPDVFDPSYLAGALVLSRIDRHLGVAMWHAHDAIWRKLEAVITLGPVDWRPWENAIHAPATPEPSPTQGATSGHFVPPAAPQSRWVAVGPTEPGRTLEVGWDVVVDRVAYDPGESCASCGAHADRVEETESSAGLRVAYCAACATHAANWKGIGAHKLEAAAVILPVLAGAVAYLPFGFAANIVASAVAGLGIGVVLLASFPIRKRVGATATIDGVRAVKAEGNAVTLFCTRYELARALSEAHETPLVPKKRLNRSARWLLPRSLPGALVAGGFLWFVFNPTLHVDNGMPRAIQIWVDGEKSVVVGPYSDDSLGESFRIHDGKHVLGWSAVDASAPVGTTHVVIDGGDPLYVPDARLCYSLEVTTYGMKQEAKEAPGPVPLAEFYAFKSIDDWFVPSPSLQKLKKGEGVVRVSIQRSRGCERLVSPACPEGARGRFWQCVVDAYPQGQKAMNACGEGTHVECTGL